MRPLESFDALALQTGPRIEYLVLCDHASNHLPAAHARLGLDDAALARHIAWDIGAAGIARGLAAALECPVAFGRWSRLLVDLNRREDAADLMPMLSDGTVIGGNLGLDAQARADRIARYHRPYHAWIEAHLGVAERQLGRPVALISVHTFTPEMAGVSRPWHAGVVWQSPRPAWVPDLLQALARDGGVIGDNQPYDGHEAMGYTLEHHGVAAGRPHVMFEVRQDLVATTAAQTDWAERLHAGLQHCGFLPGLVSPRHIEQGICS